jgi:Tfp pilus assembly protein PilV
MKKENDRVSAPLRVSIFNFLPGHEDDASAARRNGFTLVETLVGLLILTFIVTTSLVIVFERERRLQFAFETMAAYQALANEVEVQRRIPFEQLTPGESGQFETDLKIVQNLPGMVRQIDIEEISPGVKVVTLALRWRGGSRSATLSVFRSTTGGGNLW